MPNLAKLTLVELDDHSEELGGTAQLFEDCPESFPAHSIEGFGQVYKSDEQAPVLLTAFLLKLPQDKHHVRGTTLSPEAALALG